MDRRKYGGQWVNPGFSESVAASTSSIRRKSSSSRSISPPWTFRTHSEPTIANPASSIYSTMKNYMSCWPALNDKRKKVVIDGVVVANRNSLVGFFKGMGLKPKLTSVNGETVIAVDISQIRDKRMKTKFLNLTKKIAVAGTNSSSSNENSAGSDCQDMTHISNISYLSRADLFSPTITEPANRSRPDSHVDLNTSKSWPLDQPPRHTTKSFIVSMHKVTEYNEEYPISSEEERSRSSIREHSMPPANCENDCETLDVRFSHEAEVEPSACNLSFDTDQQDKSEGKTKKMKFFKRLQRWLFRRKPKEKIKSGASTKSNVIDEPELSGRGSDISIRCESVFNEEKSNDEVDDQGPPKSPEEPAKLQECNESSEILERNGIPSPKITNAHVIKSWEGLNSSVSLPAVKSRRNILNRTRYDEKGSQSLEKVSEPSERDIDRFKIVENDAAIRFKRNRIILEGGDAKYASILHNDKNFDSHFACLEDAKFSDIENHVDKVKKRIMFARAMAALSNKLPKNSPKIDLSELLWPTGDGINDDQIAAATKSSFYQKFVASMNIMRCTNRFDVCDRSVMTDEPLSSTYADFITSSLLHERRNVRKGTKGLRTSRKNKDFPKNEDANGAKKLKWLEPFAFGFKDDREDKNQNRCGNGEENWLTGFLEKVIVARNNNKKGYIKTQ